MPFTLDLYYLPLNDLLNIMNEYIKLKITYWNVDFINQTLDIDLIKIVSTRELRITSNENLTKFFSLLPNMQSLLLK